MSKLLTRNWSRRAGSGLYVPADVFTEPLFDSARHTMIKDFNVDGYANFNAAIADGWRVFNGTSVPDTHIADLAWAPPGPSYDANQLSSQTSDGRQGGKSLLVKWFGINDDAGDQLVGLYNEGHHWIYDQSDRLAGMPGTPLIFSYYRRVDYLSGHIDCDDPANPIPNGNRIMLKGEEFWPFSDMYHTGEQGRSQFQWASAPRHDYIDIPFTQAGNYGCTLHGYHADRTDINGPGDVTDASATQSGGPFPYQLVGNPGIYHRVTYSLMSHSSPTAMDGHAIMWINGNIVVGVHADLIGVLNPNRPAGTSAPYCELDVLRSHYHELAFASIRMGNIANGSPPTPFNIYIDRPRIYRGT